jgi:polysaccharide biosynthesis transport protein
MELAQLVAALRARVRLIALMVVATTFAAFVISNNLPSVYEANTRLLVGQASTSGTLDYNLLLASQRLSQTYAELALTRPSAEQVKKDLGLTASVEDILRDVTASAEPDSLFVNITAHAGTPEGAAALANSFAKAVVDISPRLFVDLPVSTAENLLTIVEPAVPPTERVAPRVGLSTLLAALSALVAGIAVALVVERLDDRVKKSEELEALTHLPVLASIGRMPQRGSEFYHVAALLYPRSGVAESFRSLRTNIGFAGLDAPIKTLLVTSAQDGDGKSTIASNLALVFAQAGNRTLLIDADLRKPSIHEFFRIPNDSGVTTLLRMDDPKIDAIAHRSEEQNLRVIPAGPTPPNPAELLSTERMHQLIVRFAADADIVIIDTPPVGVVTDAAILSRVVDGALLVARAGRSKRSAVRMGHTALERVGARIIGTVLNGVGGEYAVDTYYTHPYAAAQGGEA